jgi:hypothetical protein
MESGELCQRWVLFQRYEWMLEQFWNRVSIPRVFFETDLDEIPRLFRNRHRLSELYLVLYLHYDSFTIFTKSFSVAISNGTLPNKSS